MHLEQQRDHPLHRSDEATVDHHHPLATAVRPDGGEVEPLRLAEVERHSGDGLLTARCVADLDVEPGALERGLPGNLLAVDATPGQVDGGGRLS